MGALTLDTIGFVAIAYPKSLYIINMRGPEIIFRHMDEKFAKGKHVGLLPGHAEFDPVMSLVWTISQLAKGNPYFKKRGVLTREKSRS